MISIEVYGLGDEFFRHYVHLHVYIYALVYNTSSFKLVRSLCQFVSYVDVIVFDS